MPTPDTSNANVARVLRECAANIATLNKWRADQGDTRPNPFQDCPPTIRALADALEQTPGSDTAFQGALTFDERLDRAGGILMPTAWPQMTAKERQVYLDRWAPICTAFAPELAPTDD